MVDRLNDSQRDGFNQIVGSLDFPMYVVTTVALDDGERSGCLVGFATQCSIEPPRFLACVSSVNHTAGVAARAAHLAVHLVPRDRDDLASLFGEETGDMVDKFSRCRWSSGPGGVPLLDDCAARFLGAILDRVPLGDHVGYVLDPVEAAGTVRPDGYVTFRDVRGMDAGHPA